MLLDKEFLGDGDEVTDDKVEGDGGGEGVGDEGDHEWHHKFHLDLHIASEVLFKTFLGAGFFFRKIWH